MLASGSIIIFDELINYHGWEEGEFKAFMEFIEEHNVTFEYVAYNRTGSQVAVRILGTAPTECDINRVPRARRREMVGGAGIEPATFPV